MRRTFQGIKSPVRQAFHRLTDRATCSVFARLDQTEFGWNINYLLSLSRVGKSVQNLTWISRFSSYASLFVDNVAQEFDRVRRSDYQKNLWVMERLEEST
jgi:hypothetical protein